MPPKQRLNLVRILALLAVIGLSVLAFLYRDQLRSLAQYGYLGIFLLSFLANATILLPAPGVVFVFAMGAIYNPIGVALAAGAGSALGEISGYLIGFSGQGVVENKVRYQRILTWMQEHPHLRNLAILILAFIPNPLFDLAGIAAGTLRVPITSFLFFTLLGKIGKMLLFAYLGASSLDWFTK